MAKAAKSTEDPLVAQAFDASKHAELAEAIERLNPDEAAFFLEKLEVALKKRKLQLTGYIVAMIGWLIGMVCALAYYGVSEGFVGWVFLMPFAFVGLTLYLFGRAAEKLGRSAEKVGAAGQSSAAGASKVTPAPAGKRKASGAK